MLQITKAQNMEYGPHGQIRLAGFCNVAVKDLAEAEIVEPLVGWGEYTHVVKVVLPWDADGAVSHFAVRLHA